MSVIKFNPASPPSYVRSFGNGWFALIADHTCKPIGTNDYIIVKNGDIVVVSQADYTNNVSLKRKVVEEIAIQLLEDMIQALDNLAVTDLVKLDLLKTVDVVLIMVVGNKIQAARQICNAIATTANFTTARKNALLALLDTAIALL